MTIRFLLAALLVMSTQLAGCSRRRGEPPPETKQAVDDVPAPAPSPAAQSPATTRELPRPPLALTPPAPPSRMLDGLDLSTLAPARLVADARALYGQRRFREAAAALHYALLAGRGSAYDLACDYALQNEVDAAFYWLQKAAEDGVDARRAEVDPDLAVLRADARWRSVASYLSASSSYWVSSGYRTASLVVPTGYTVGTPIATLIGLHGLGHEPHAFVDAAMYQQLADALQVAVVGVSGTVALGKRSFVWSGNVRRDGEHVRRVLADLAGKLTVAGGKRTLFGFSQGAQVAFEIAIQEPQEYLGAVVMSPGSSRNAQLQQSARGTHSHQAFVCTSGAAERPEVVQQTNADCQIARESGARVELKLYPGVSQHRLPSDFESAFPAWVGFIGGSNP